MNGDDCEERTVSVSMDCNNNQILVTPLYRVAETINRVNWKGISANGKHMFSVQNPARQQLGCATTWWSFAVTNAADEDYPDYVEGIGQMVLSDTEYTFYWDDDQGFFMNSDGDYYQFRDDEKAALLLDRYYHQFDQDIIA